MHFGLMALVTVVMHMVSAQDRNVLRQGGSQNTQSEISTPRTRAFLSCESGDIVVKVNFTQPFRGLMYAHRSRNSPCKVQGFGDRYYELRIPLKGCGTWQESPRVFVNNITIRFHPALELEEDETKTVVCRYPPPLTPKPGGIYVVEPPTPTPSESRVQAAKLSEVEILIIICLLLFLSLLTLGIGIAYFCLKRRNIHLVRRKTLSSGPASQLTKLSGSTPQQPSQLSGAILDHTVKIPRAVPYSASLRTQTLSDPYQENTPGIKRDSLDSSPSTSTTSGDSSEGIQLLHHDSHGRRNLTIPKAVLKKREFANRTLPHLHKHFSLTGQTSSRGEFEDQTVTTVLEPEYNDYGNNRDTRKKAACSEFPIYAQVEKKKQRVRIAENAEVMQLEDSDPQHVSDSRLHAEKRASIPIKSHGQELKLTKSADGQATNKFITKNISTTVLREGSLPLQSADEKTSHYSKDTKSLQQGREIANYREAIFSSRFPKQSESTLAVPQERTLCIQDISDVYVTTTVETESMETKTTVSRDIIEEHVKDTRSSFDAKNGNANQETVGKTKDSGDSNFLSNTTKKEPSKKISDSDYSPVAGPSSRHPEPTKLPISSDEVYARGSKSSPTTENWNVVIRQRKTPTSSDSNVDEEEALDSLTQLPRFDIKIRTIPPRNTKREGDSANELLGVPRLQMPHSIEKIRDAMTRLDSAKVKEVSHKTPTSKHEVSKGNSANQPKGVWWPENSDPIVSTYTPEPVSDSDTSHSIASNRERSSSEVLEKAPVLLSQNKYGHSTLERSSSEIVTAPENYNKESKDVPVLQSFSPEFLKNIPVVTRGGFFHEPTSPDVANKSKTDTKGDISPEAWYI